MNEEQATHLAEQLVGATTGWDARSIATLIETIQEWHDYEAAENAVWWATHNWVERSHPPMGWLYRAYNEAREAERRANEQSPRDLRQDIGVIDPAMGRTVAYRAYRESLHLEDSPETVARFQAGGVGVWGDVVEKGLDEDDPDLATALIAVGEGAMYVVVLRSFGGDHLRAGRALRTLEKAGRIVHRANGWITPR